MCTIEYHRDEKKKQNSLIFHAKENLTKKLSMRHIIRNVRTCANFFFTHPLQILKGNYGNFHKRAQQQGTTETREVGERLLHGGCYLFDLRVQSSWREAIGGATVAYQPFSARSAARFGCCSMQTARSFAGRALCTTARIYTRYYCDIVSPPPLSNLCKTKFEITPRGRPSSAAPRNLFVNFRSNIYSTRLDWKANSRVHGWKIISRPGGCSTV